MFKPIEIAVCGLILDKDNNILLTKRSKNLIYSGAWVCPGGRVEPQEELEESLLREI